MQQNLIWSNNAINKSAVNLDKIAIIAKENNSNSTQTTYRIVFYFLGQESTYWNYNDPCLRNQDYNQLLTTYCKDISQ